MLSRLSFNPRTRVGCDPPPACLRTTLWTFQSTHPRGVRPDHGRLGDLSGRVSIHAPAWGATWCCACGWASVCTFQSTHPRGVRRRGLPGGHRPVAVSIHAPAWGATRALKAWTSAGWRFQSTHPRGVRPAGWRKPSTSTGFQSTHPRGVRLSFFSPSCRDWIRFQSTHPRGVRRGCPELSGPPRPVSIHAPAWGATRVLRRGRFRGNVSIHAPAWGATPTPRASPVISPGFQSTHPRGVRLPPVCARCWLVWFQSTHPRGVRPAQRERRATPQQLFQSTHPRGVRLLEAWNATAGWTFQSTHPRGVRPTRRSRWCWRASFNPRTRVGCDGQLCGDGRQLPLFQSTHPRGVRPGKLDLSVDGTEQFQSTHPRGVRRCVWLATSAHEWVSIHAPAWGATRAQWEKFHDRPCFNPRTRVGCDLHGKKSPSSKATFQSTHPRGVRRAGQKRTADEKGFQSTHPRGVRRI